MTIQREIIINDIKVQVIEDDGINYYPISYMLKKVLLKKSVSNEIHTKEEYKKYIKQLDIDYGYSTGGIQNMYCMDREGFILYLSNPKSIVITRLNADQRKGLNSVLVYFGLETVSEGRYENTYEINEYVQDCINEVIKENNDIEYRVCAKCGNNYPMHINFFNKDKRLKNGFTNICRICTGHNIIHNDKEKGKIYNDFKIEGYNLSKENVVEFYIKYVNGTETKPPKEIYTRDNYLELLKYYYDKGVITKENISKGYLEETFNITLFRAQINIHEIYEHLFGIDYKYNPWEYGNLSLAKLSIEDGKIIFNNYIENNNINIENIFEMDYGTLLKKSKLTQFTNNTLDFVVKYYNDQYAGYLFKMQANNYYKNEDRRILDMKYLIEKDMKIPIEKIPLYLTKFSLRKKSNALYYLLYNGKYYKNLFEWINICYKDKFILADFEINAYRNEYDSLEEGQIDDILHDKFENVIYNQRNTTRTISIESKIPDWFIFTSSGCYIIEYFGLYVDRTDSTRINDYKKRTEEKLKKYKNLKGYKFMDFYPIDLDNNFQGILDKIKLIS